MTARLALVGGFLALLLAGVAGWPRASDHSYDLAIVGTASSGYRVTKPGLFEVDYLRTTKWNVTSTADVALDLQFDGLATSGRCRIEFSPHDPAYDCKSVRTTISPGDAAVTFTAYAKDLPIWEYSWPPLSIIRYPSEVMLGPVSGLLIPSDPDLELERDLGTIAVLLAVLGLLGIGTWWRLRRGTV